MRDFFSAGGVCQITLLDGTQKVVPHIAGELLENLMDIKQLLDNPDKDLIQDIEEYWDFDYDLNNLFNTWISKIENHFNNNISLKHIPIRELVNAIVCKY